MVYFYRCPARLFHGLRRGCVAFVAGVTYGFYVETIDQLKAELSSLSKAFERSGTTENALGSSNAEWFQLGVAQNKLPGLISMLHVVVEHLEQLERSAERHRNLSHEHMRNGDTRMSLRAKTLAQYEDRLRTVLQKQLTNAWNEALEEETV